jgi:AcrR family transcriptional regulator
MTDEDSGVTTGHGSVVTTGHSSVMTTGDTSQARTGDMALDGRRERGRRTRESILATAVDIASVDGLEGLTIGRLATELGMSKSGLFAHFGSKEELQLATIAAAREIFVDEVVAPARDAEPGLPRLQALLEAKLDYLRRGVFRGGCFFDAARLEYDSRHPGPVRDAILDQFAAWSKLVAGLVRAAQREGHIDPDADPEQIAFELDAIGAAANLRMQIRRDEDGFDRAQQAIHARIQALTARPA